MTISSQPFFNKQVEQLIKKPSGIKQVLQLWIYKLNKEVFEN